LGDFEMNVIEEEMYLVVEIMNDIIEVLYERLLLFPSFLMQQSIVT
jgi:hypothetical protein